MTENNENQSEENQKADKKYGLPIWVLIIVLLSFTLIALLPLIEYKSMFDEGLGLSNDHGTWSQFGTFFGGVVGTILSYISVMFLVISLRQQNTALRYQMDELKIQRATLQEMKKEIETQEIINRAQVENIEIQRFENRFNSFLDSKRILWESLFPKDLYSNEAINLQLINFRKVASFISKNPNSYIAPKYIRLRDHFLLEKSRYFNFIIQIYDYVDSLDDIEEKKDYFKMLHNMLSVHEIIVLLAFKFCGIRGCLLGQEIIDKINILLFDYFSVTEEEFFSGGQISAFI